MELYEKGKDIYYLDSNGNKVYITDTNGKKLFVTDNFVDIEYASRQSLSSTLSNLFPYKFKFRGKDMESIEGALQSLKFKEKIAQSMVWSYSGKDAYHVRAASFGNDWRKTATLYWQGKSFNRFDIEYQRLLDELYLSIFCGNDLFRRVLIHSGHRVLLHTMGESNPKETILTPDEYIERLTTVRNIAYGQASKKTLDELSEKRVDEYIKQKLLCK